MNKRLIGIILSISMLISLFGSGITARAAIGIEHEAEVSKLNAFGILTGYPDTNYKAGAAVAAKDFVAAAYKTANREGDFAGAMAQKFGFGAEDKTISVQNAIAVLLTALDYGYEAEAAGGYPSGYNKTASSYKLLNGAGISFTDNLTNDAMAVILYNALDLKVMKPTYSNGYLSYSKTDETVMNMLDIYEGKGIVTGTEYAAMNGCSKASGNGIVIDNGARYSLGNTYADSLFGYSVEFYYNEDHELLWIDARNNMSLSRVAEVDVVSLTEGGIRFEYSEDREKSYGFNNVTFVYNGVSVENPDLSAFVPKSGYIVVIDNNNDNKAEVIACESYDYYLVSEKNTATKTVNDYETNRSVSLNEDDYKSVKIIKNGKTVSFDDIASNDVIAVMKSDSSGGVLRAIVSTYKSVSGDIKATSSEAVRVDDTVYSVSTAYEGSTLSTGKTGTFYFDINGNIVRFSKGKTTTSQYAYLISAYVGDNGEDCYVKLLTAGDTIEEHKLKTKVRYNTGTITAANLCVNLRDGGSTVRQLVTYALDSDGNVSKLCTADKSNMYSNKDEVSDSFSQYFQGHGRYRKNNLCFNSKYLIESDTPIFVVPSSREQKDYDVKYASDLTNGTSYYISVFDIDEYMTAGAIVLDEVESEPEQLKAKRSMIIEDISVGVNEDDDMIIIVEGYQQGAKVSLKTEDKAVLKDSEGKYYSLGEESGYTQLSCGDIIQTSVDSSGYLTAFRTLYKADEEKKKLVIADNNTPNEYEEGGNADEFSDLFVLHGNVISRSANVIVVESDTRRAHRITSGATVYVVSGKNVRRGTVSDIGVNDEVYLHTYQGNLQEVVIYR